MITTSLFSALQFYFNIRHFLFIKGWNRGVRKISPLYLHFPTLSKAGAQFDVRIWEAIILVVDQLFLIVKLCFGELVTVHNCFINICYHFMQIISLADE